MFLLIGAIVFLIHPVVVIFLIHPVVILCGCFLAILWYFLLASVKELSINFSHLTYQIRRGFWPFVRTETGHLSEVSHLLVIAYDVKVFKRKQALPVTKKCLDVIIFWSSGNPKEFTLQTVIDNNQDNLASAKKKLKTYADQLAARLHVPVIEDVEA